MHDRRRGRKDARAATVVRAAWQYTAAVLVSLTALPVGLSGIPCGLRPPMACALSALRSCIHCDRVLLMCSPAAARVSVMSFIAVDATHPGSGASRLGLRSLVAER